MEAINQTLFIRSPKGRYSLASDAAVLEVATEILDTELHGQQLGNPRQTVDFLRAAISRREHEVFMMVSLDNRHRVIATDELFRGTIDGASVYPREVVKTVLAHNAAAVIFAHNHPSGIAEPSQADRHIPRRLIDALGLIDVRVLDHIVIGSTETVSFAERGLI